MLQTMRENGRETVRVLMGNPVGRLVVALVGVLAPVIGLAGIASAATTTTTTLSTASTSTQTKVLYALGLAIGVAVVIFGLVYGFISILHLVKRARSNAGA